MSGKVNGSPTRENDLCYENNLQYAAKLLEKENILGLIEPINNYSVPSYYMNCYNKGNTYNYSILFYLWKTNNWMQSKVWQVLDEFISDWGSLHCSNWLKSMRNLERQYIARLLILRKHMTD